MANSFLRFSLAYDMTMLAFCRPVVISKVVFIVRDYFRYVANLPTSSFVAGTRDIKTKLKRKEVNNKTEKLFFFLFSSSHIVFVFFLLPFNHSCGTIFSVITFHCCCHRFYCCRCFFYVCLAFFRM